MMTAVFKTYSSSDVGEILSPTGQAHRSIAQHRRRSHELLGVKIANKYRYPKFQIDPERREIIPGVKYKIPKFTNPKFTNGVRRRSVGHLGLVVQRR